ncbi:metal ABC transporter substrate-binding protein [Paractinoplanes brasiliensis]|uniref:Zinc transport system substrate-binding protein n=1 Tax=Paractinoplanes brasiliensis TaxID=52695 RepID=A0A4V3C7K9_9ACTN|nr:metal ABC transporter substrate-binding protein [Actinoplanes brasiliensis]TDO38068.1 zinc transport system substrate-binding protein [Actinoplanes brasiliensis]GID31159.1 zinc ABC transporter substrate-binding protein [Actinoplanes brasiliensis]
MRRRLLSALLVPAVALAGCGDQAASGEKPEDGKFEIVTAFYPLQFLSERIGGDVVSVTNLTKPGAEPHDLELTPRQVGQIADAGLAVYIKGFQPAVDEAIGLEAEDKGFDAAAVVPLLPAGGEDDDGHEHSEAEGGEDPHVWLDPVRLATIAGKLAERLGQADPAHAAGYAERARALGAELTALNTEFAAGLKTCDRRELVTSHTAFAYLAARYDLHQVGITGISPEAEPSPQRLAAVAREARETGATTIFFETLVSPAVAETIAREVGARTAVLDPLEGLTDSTGDYFTVMRQNLATLETGLGCK